MRRDVSLPLRGHALSQALLGAMALLALGPALADESAAAADDQVTTLDQLNVRGERGYSVQKSNAGTRMDLSLREIPQSVSVITRDRIDDQNLQSITDVLQNVTGVYGTTNDSERWDFFARGFYIDNYQFDGIPTIMEAAWSYGDSALDLSIYDRVEVVRGATGLLTGAGNPSASINLIRKHADSRELAGSVSVNAGGFGGTRTTADVSTPLNASGSVRARVVGTYGDTDSWTDRYNVQKKLGYAVIDADLGQNTVLSVGHEYQKKSSDDVTWGGFPLRYADGGIIDVPVAFNPAAEWTYWDTTLQRTFASLDHRFGNGWLLKANATHDKTKADDKLFYVFGSPDRTTGAGLYGWPGYYQTERKVDGLDAYVSGPFQAFGREHQLVAGVSYNRREYVNNSAAADVMALDGATYFGGTGAFAEPTWAGFAESSAGTVTQKAGYAATRLSLADPLTLILGARYTDWEGDTRESGVAVLREHQETTPYAGLVYDIDQTWSTYLSYTDIFQPQSYQDAEGRYLDPVVGKSYEAGVKAAWFDNRLNASLALFRIEQDNVAQDTGAINPDTGQSVYVAALGTVSEGFDFEVSGALTQGWNATFGASHYTARDADDVSINKHLPRTSIKLFTSYTPQGEWSDLTVGGGVNWQNRTYTVDATYGTFQQDAYALVGLFARYRIAPQFSVQLNLENLTDERYYRQINGGAAWGAPRNGSLTFNWTF